MLYLQHQKHVDKLQIQILKMRVLIALMLLVLSYGVTAPSNHRFIVFTHDGTFYKLDPETKQVQWHNQLPFKLLSLDLNPQQQLENHTKKLFIPTIDGDFLYLQHGILIKHPKQILVPRQDVEHLLDMCFDSTSDEKYFVYQKLQYFVLNTQNGQFHALQDYLAQGHIFNRNTHSIIIVAKKLLKQLNLKLEVKWSVISSKITLIDVDNFVKNSNINGKIAQAYVQHQNYKFIRVDPRSIKILDQLGNVVFQIQASSSIMNIFYEDKNLHQFQKMLIKNQKHKLLAIGEAASQIKRSQMQNEITEIIQEKQKKFQNFPTSSHFVVKQQGNENPSNEFNHLQMCIKTHKILKQAGIASNQARIFSSQKQKIFHQSISHPYPQIPLNFNLYDFNPQDLPTLPYSSDKRIHVIVTKQQPFVYIFLIAIILGGGFAFYRFKVNKLLEHISQVQNITDENIKKFTQKLGEYQNVGKQLKKMYEINWDKVLYRNQCYFVFQGRFLNQNAEVFVLPINGFDIIDIQQKLNILINCSHKYITKLYYYTRNDDSLLIFCEKSSSLRRINQLGEWETEVYQKFVKDEESYRNCIQILMDSIYQLMSMKIQINSFNQQSLLVSESLDIKINIIPSFLHKNLQEEEKKLKQMGTSKLRLDVISVIHKIGHKGAAFDLLTFQKEKNSNSEQNSFLKDFYDHFLLTESNPSDLQALKNSQKHPFLWDSKQKMLYVCDFSNYVETCIDDYKISKMESHCRNYQIIPLPWNLSLHPTFIKQVNNYRKYDFNSTRDLIRLIRNKLSHFHEIPKQTRAIVGKTPEQFVEHFLQKFPKLLSFMYVYATKKKWKLSTNN